MAKDADVPVPPKLSLNLRVRGLRSSSTVAINEHCDALIAQGRKVYKLGLGQSPFPVPEPVVEALKANAHQKDYLAVKGLPELRDRLAARYSGKFGPAYTRDDVLVGPGSKELMFILQVVFYGDLLLPTPAWVSYAPQARIIGHQVQQLSTRRENGWKLLPEDLRTLCEFDPARPRVLILNYPSNPTGQTYTDAELKALADVCRAFGVIVLSDEIYGRLHHQGKHASIVRHYPEGTIYSGGLSKWCGAGGWRLGFFVFPPGLRELADAMAAVASETYTSTSAPIQHAAISAFTDDPRILDYIRKSRAVLSFIGRGAAQRLRAAGAEVDDPEGGFYLFPYFGAFKEKMAARGIKTSKDFCSALLEDTGVAILPGSDFGRPPRELTARLAYVNFDGAKALTEASPEAAAKPVFEAVDKLCFWL